MLKTIKIPGLNKISRKKFYFGLAVVLVLLGLLIFVFIKRSGERTTTEDPNGLGVSGPLVKIPVPNEPMSIEKLQERVNYLQGTQQFDEAIRLIKSQSYFNEDVEARILLAFVQSNQGKHEEALATLKQAEKKKTSYGLLRNIAEEAEILKDNTLALEYYKKALSSYEQTATGSSGEVKRLETKIKELEGNN